MENINEMDYLSFNMKINAAGNVSIETYDDFGKIYKETGWGYNKVAFTLGQLAYDRLNISSDLKNVIRADADIDHIESISKSLGGSFTKEELYRNHYHCVLKLPKECFYSNEFMQEMRLVESTQSVKELSKLADSKFDKIKQNVVWHKKANLDILEKLSKDSSKDVSFSALNQIYRNDKNCDIDIKRKIVGHPKCSQHILEKFLNENNLELNPRIHSVITKTNNQSILEHFSKSKDEFLRWCVSKNPNISSNIIGKLSNDPENDVKVEIAKNKNTHNGILRSMYDSYQDFSIRSAVLTNLASNPNTPKDQLENLEKHINMFQVALGFVRNPETSKELLEKISNIDYKTENYLVKDEMLNHPNITKDIVEKLCNEESSLLSSKAMNRILDFKENTKDTINKVSTSVVYKILELAPKKIKRI